MNCNFEEIQSKQQNKFIFFFRNQKFVVTTKNIYVTVDETNIKEEVITIVFEIVVKLYTIPRASKFNSQLNKLNVVNH